MVYPKASIEILNKAQNGDTSALSNIYEIYANRIYRYIFARLQNKEIAEDLTSRVFIRIIKYLYSFDASKNFDTWIFTIAKNEIADYFRKTRYTYDLKEVEEILVDKDAENNMFRKVLLEVLQIKLKQLDHDEKEILSLSYFGGVDDRSIAQIINKSHSNVRVIKSRAIKKLKLIVNTKSQNAKR